MQVYAGIDEAGYGPIFGPLLVGRCVFAIDDLDATQPPPDLWKRLNRAVCRTLTKAKRKLAINDSKKVYTPASGLRHLELGVLAFARLLGHQPSDIALLLDCLGEQAHRSPSLLPWYQATVAQPWQTLPTTCTPDQVAIAANMLRQATQKAQVRVLDLCPSVLFEDRFNQMVAQTRSKAAASFTFVASHLQAIWDQWGQHGPLVIVDRQSGRSYYRELLALYFPQASLMVVREDERVSTYILEAGDRRLRVSFQVEAEQHHLPVALASMLSKYTRELLMLRFKSFFAQHAANIAPTAGYGSDASRFWQQIQPLLPTLPFDATHLRRSC